MILQNNTNICNDNTSCRNKETGSDFVFPLKQKAKRPPFVRHSIQLLTVMLVIFFLLPCLPASKVSADVATNGYVSVGSANVRSAPGTVSTSIVISLARDTRVLIGDLVKISADPSGYLNWNKVSAVVNGRQYDGYIVSTFVKLGNAATTPTPTPTPAPTPVPAASPEFEAQIAAYPESYRPSLRALHQAHPSWIFNAVNIAPDWSTVVTAESVLGRSLITNSVADSWKSTEKGAYDPLTNTYKIFDGTTWVNASKDVVAYYLDPRNFLSETYVFQFLNQSYDPATQTQAGVEKVLNNTFMAAAVITDPSGLAMTYAQAFMMAGEISGASPYQLISRVLQEVSAQGSRSTSGIEPGFPSHYNFYNIGAVSSPDPVALGLTFAVNGSNNPGSYQMSPANKALYLIPWNSQYKSIVGGAKYISNNYILKGQSSLYFQKFDVKEDAGNGFYTHQYMTNIEAMIGESSTLYNAYAKSGTLDLPLVFSIPVYSNMPAAAVVQPAKTSNANNLLKSLSVDSFSITPAFDPAVTDGYTLTVPFSASVTITAAAAASTSTVSGTGTIPLFIGSNLLSVSVTSQNGSVRTYHITVTRSPDPGPNVTYQTHVQDIGWQGYTSSGETSGTYAQSKRLEAIRMNLGNVKGGIEYRTHVQDVGWMNWVADSAVSGTSGESKRLEAIQIRLTGDAAAKYDVYYRVHAQNNGWLDWAKNGESAGTSGYSFRLEAIQIVLVAKSAAAPGATVRPYVELAAATPVIPPVNSSSTVSYQTHVQDIGWQGYVSNGVTSGTSAQSRRLEAIQIKLENMTGGIEYKTHVQDKGWLNWTSDGAISGTSGESKRLEAIQIRLTGLAAEQYDVYYRVHAQNFGWLDWAKNGEPAGSAGYSYRLEAIQIVLVPKGAAAPGATAIPFKQA